MQLNLAQSLQINIKMTAVNRDINKYNSFCYLEHLNRIDVRLNSTNSQGSFLAEHIIGHLTDLQKK